MGELVIDPEIDAISKWNQLLAVTNQWKIEQKEGLLSFAKIINMDENLPLKHKLITKSSKLLAADYAVIIQQGVDEGVFDTQTPIVVAELVVAVLHVFSDGLTDLLLNQNDQEQPFQRALSKVNATQFSIERILGAPTDSLTLIDQATLAAWFK